MYGFKTPLWTPTLVTGAKSCGNSLALLQTLYMYYTHHTLEYTWQEIINNKILNDPLITD